MNSNKYLPAKEEGSFDVSGCASSHESNSFLDDTRKEYHQGNKIRILVWLSISFFIALVMNVFYTLHLQANILSDERCAKQLSLPGEQDSSE